MTNLPTPLTPQQKLEYLCAKLETVVGEMQAVTGLRVQVGFGVHSHITDAAELPQLVTAAEEIGFERNEWDDEPVGGFWQYGIVSGYLTVHDSNMPHAEGPVINIDSRDEEVLGRDFINTLNANEAER